uniref:PARP catalytic domain-containing protein n=1 Tax=Brassica oleracea var. oleracea TaxID=109376 RepID=A0A0D3C8C0_BRAOL
MNTRVLPEFLVCIKTPFNINRSPRRLRSPWMPFLYQPGADDVCESKVGADLLDIFRRKEETLALDARFGDSKLNLVSPSLSPLIPSPSRVKGGGCGRVKFGIKSAAVRVEGFDCLDRDRQNSSIPAMA